MKLIIICAVMFVFMDSADKDFQNKYGCRREILDRDAVTMVSCKSGAANTGNVKIKGRKKWSFKRLHMLK